MVAPSLFRFSDSKNIMLSLPVKGLQISRQNGTICEVGSVYHSMKCNNLQVCFLNFYLYALRNRASSWITITNLIILQSIAAGSVHGNARLLNKQELDFPCKICFFIVFACAINVYFFDKYFVFLRYVHFHVLRSHENVYRNNRERVLRMNMPNVL